MNHRSDDPLEALAKAADARRLTFDRFDRATDGPLAPQRSELFFDCLPLEEQDECWRELAERCERENEIANRLAGDRGLAA